MTVHSAGIVLFRRSDPSSVEVLLVHPGGPYFTKKDAGVWTIPKGEYDPLQEDALVAARREFAEETGGDLGAQPFGELGWTEQRSGKIVHAFAFEGDFDPAGLVSNEFEIEWPPRSGERRRFPEVDQAAWFGIDAAREKILATQAVFLRRLLDVLSPGSCATG